MKYIIERKELTPDDIGYLRELKGTPLYEALGKVIGNRIDARKEDLTNAKWFDLRSNRARIDELHDLLLELTAYQEG